jgi:NADPH2:quinone reductase
MINSHKVREVNMKAVVTQDGQIYIADVPVPQVERNFILVETDFSAVSPGTEMMMLMNKPTTPIYMGYSATGLVKEVGEGVTHVQVGQRVACYGAPFVNHAEYLLVPKPLAVPVPSHVDPREASMAGLGAIAIHALRQADLRFGESVVILGLGILGQVMAQIAHAASFRVIGYDLMEERCRMLQAMGIQSVSSTLEELEEEICVQTNGEGVDCVILCAGGKASGLIDQGLNWIRDRGKVLVVGDLKTEFNRENMFRKEAQVLISRAGGPGRYDKSYERDGFEYPIGFVRWTEGRNIAEYIRLLAAGSLNITPLISKQVPFQYASEAYHWYMNSPQDVLGVVFEYATGANNSVMGA